MANPRGQTYPIVLRTWIDGFRLPLFPVAGVASPFAMVDWPNPRGVYGMMIWTQINLLQTTLMPSVVRPMVIEDWYRNQ